MPIAVLTRRLVNRAPPVVPDHLLRHSRGRRPVARASERDDDQERLAAQREAAIAVRAHPRLAARTPLSDCHASRWLVRLRAGRPPRWGSKEDQAKRERSLSHPSLFRQTDRSGDEFERPVGKYPLAEPAKAATGRGAYAIRRVNVCWRSS